MANFPIIETTLDKVVGGGQTLGTDPDGRKLFVWGGLPGETVTVQVTKKRARLTEGRVVDVLQPSPERIPAADPDSFLSTSPWQIMTAEAEQHYKAALIEEAFELHDIVLPEPITIQTDGNRFRYRNKVEFSWYWDNEAEKLELAFFVRASKGKIPVDGTSLARPEINKLARKIRDLLRTKDVVAYNLKTLMIRCNQAGQCVWQLYTKDDLPDIITSDEAEKLPAQGGEIIFSDPRSPASRVTTRQAKYGNVVLSDTIMGIPFNYAAESFFQVNLPVYEMTLLDIQKWLSEQDTVDMYSGVGTIGLTVGKGHTTLVESDDYAANQMKFNIKSLKKDAEAVHATSETALEYITKDSNIILDPPRAGLHRDVVDRLLEVKPLRIVYLSCNPVTQARDVALLADIYGVKAHTGYNFFPATPHIEHLVVLDLKP